MGIRIYSGTVTTTGSAGSASGSATLFCGEGWIEWVDFDFHASAPGATTDTTVTVNEGRGDAVLVLTDTATDVRCYIREPAVSQTGAAITNSGEKIAINEPITVSMAQTNALDPALTFYVCVSADE